MIIWDILSLVRSSVMEANLSLEEVQIHQVALPDLVAQVAL